VNVSLSNANNGVPTRLSLETTNALVFAFVSLLSNEATGGEFAVKANTSNSPFHVEFPVAPIDHVLHFSGKASHSPSYVNLHPTYEGSFFLSSSILKPRVVVAGDVEDPKGEGRTRDVTYKKSGSELSGNVRWVSDKDVKGKEGSVELVTSILIPTLNM
jgi:hypothetical protein